MLDAENPDAAGSPTETDERPAQEEAGAVTTGNGAAPAAAPDTPDAAAGEGPDAGTGDEAAAPAKKAAAKRTTAKKATTKKAATKKTAAKRTTKKAAAESKPDETAAVAASEDAPVPAASIPAGHEPGEASDQAAGELPVASADQAGPGPADAAEGVAPAKKTAKKAARKAPAKRAPKKAAASPESSEAAAEAPEATEAGETAPVPTEATEQPEESARTAPAPATALLFQPPDPTKAVVTTRRRKATRPEAPAAADAGATGEAEETPAPAKKAAKKGSKKPAPAAEETPEAEKPAEQSARGAQEPERGEGDEEQGGERRRRRRGGRRRRRSGGGEENDSAESSESTGEGTAEESGEVEESEEQAGSGSRRRRRRRRSGDSGEGSSEEENTVTRVRKPRNAEDEITAVTGSTRLEAKKQRRREGREAGRRRAPIVSEAEFLARRESVDRVMVIRQRQDLTQIAVLEDKVLVEHYVSRESQTSLIGNVYLGRVQNVLPSMEAAFIDIGKGRNAVLYAGEVNWDALGAKNGQPRKIEAVLKSGQPILVQVTKDPIGHKGARLTSQISLPGRFLVYVPDGTTSGISRKLPDTERNRLKTLLKDIVPDTAGVIVRTAAEGASEEELTRDVERLTARWSDIEKKASSGNAPQLLYGEPDLTLKVVRDLFTEDFNKLVIAGDDAWDLVEGYVTHVAPDLSDRLERYDGQRDVFSEYRIDEQIEKALDRKVWLPSGGSLVIDRTEAMTVVDVNTGKFTGSGGNLEETVTKNNLEAAEEIVRQLRLRDIGGIIVVDFIDMVLESNRDLVLRRLVECLGRDRTRHQVAEVTSLGLVQMTRKRIGTGLLEAFSENCEHCQGRGLVLHHEPVEPKRKSGEDESRRGRRGRGRGGEVAAGNGVPSPKDIAAMAKHEERPEDSGEEAGPEPAEAMAPDAALAPAEAQEPIPDVAAARGDTGAAEGEVADAEKTAPGSQPSGRGRGRGGRGRGRGTQPDAPADSEARAGSATEEGVTPAEGQEAAGEQSPAPAPAAASSEQPPAEAAERPVTETAAGVPADASAAKAAEEPVAAAKGADKTSEEGPVEAQPAAPAAPTVVTTVRRRSARRAAGPPSQASPAAATATPSDGADFPGPDAPAGDVSPAAAVDGGPSADEVVDQPADVEPLATLLDDAEVDGPSASSGAETDPDGHGGSGESSATPHVPIKKRGSRRR